MSFTQAANSIKTKPMIIFDFDGTIADTFTPTMEILALDYQKWGDPFHKKHTINHLRSLTIAEIVKTIPGGWWKFSYLLLKSKKHIDANMSKIKAYPGIIYTIRSLYDDGYPLAIVTSNKLSTVTNFLKQFNLDKAFLGIYPTKGLFRKAKKLKQVLKKYNLKPYQAFYIGDEIRDIHACQKIDLPIIAVSYGFNAYEGLAKYRPNYLAKKPIQILTYLQSLEK